MEKEINLDKPTKAPIASIKSRIRRGILAKSLLVRGESIRKFEELRLKVTEELLPQTEVEKLLCDKFISASWKHQRAVEVETNILSKQNTPEATDEDSFDSALSIGPSRKRMRNIRKVRLDTTDVQKVLRYQLDLERTMLKILERYREEQKLRKSGEN